MSKARLFKGFICASVLLTAWSVGYVAHEPAIVVEASIPQEASGNSLIAIEPPLTQGPEPSIVSAPEPSERTISQPLATPLPPDGLASIEGRPAPAGFPESPKQQSEQAYWQPSAAQVQPNAARRPSSTFIPHHSTLPASVPVGNSMETNGRRVVVEGVAVSPEGVNEVLEVSITPVAPPEEAPNASSGVAAKRWLARRPSGFTEEEELFRMRWGWEAFAQAQRLAAESR